MSECMRGIGYHEAGVKSIRTASPKPPVQDMKENLVYILQRLSEVAGAFSYSNIVAASTDKEMIFDTAKDMAKEEFYKSRKRGKWDYTVLVYDNKSGKFLDRVEIPRYHE